MLDEDLLKRAHSGDGDAILTLLEGYKDHLYSCAYHYLGSREDAIDALQETAFRVYKNIKKLKKEENNLKAWFTRILINHCKDVIKKRNRMMVFDITSIIRMKNEETYDDGLDSIFIKEQVRSLKSPYRELIVMRYIQDMKISTIAKVMNKPESTVKYGINRGISMLRKLMEVEEGHVERG